MASTKSRSYSSGVRSGMYGYPQDQTPRTIVLYQNSRFETGIKDTLNREIPFTRERDASPTSTMCASY